MFDKKKYFKCNEYGIKFDACVGSGFYSKVVHPSKHGVFEQKRYWGN